MRRFSVELLRESPAPALRACSSLAQVYQPLARELFNAAFVSCWTELDGEGYQEYLVRSLETVFSSPETPPEILQALLNLAEFMEHDDKALPIDIRYLGEHAEKCHAYAKALHYKELEFQSSPETCIESLISINNQLEQHEAAVGILKYAQDHLQRRPSPTQKLPAPQYGLCMGNGANGGVSALSPKLVEVKESWFEKLGRWDDALRTYEARLLQLGPQTTMDRELGATEQCGNFVTSTQYMELTLGRMRCLDALGEFEKVAGLAQEMWPLLTAAHAMAASRQLAVAGGGGSSAVHPTGGGANGRGHGQPSHVNGESEQQRLERLRLLSEASVGSDIGGRRSPLAHSFAVAGPFIGDSIVSVRRTVASLAARASWALEEWVAMERYVAATDNGVVEGALMRAVLSIQHARYARAQTYIDQARVLLDAPLSALVGESYNRVYKTLVIVQQLAELEEIVDYKRRWGTEDVIAAAGRNRVAIVASPHVMDLRMASRRRMHSMWRARLEGCQRQVSVWSSLLSVRSLVFSPREDVGTWLKFAGICRRASRHSLCLKTLMRLGIVDRKHGTKTYRVCFDEAHLDDCVPSPLSLDPRVAFGYLKYLWATGAAYDAVRRLRVMCEALEVINPPPNLLKASGACDKECLRHLRTKLQLKLGNWVLHLHEQRRVRRLHGHLDGGYAGRKHSPFTRIHGSFTSGFTKADDGEYLLCVIPDVLAAFRRATELSPLSYKAWHAWALMNFQAAHVYSRADRLKYHTLAERNTRGRHSTTHNADFLLATAGHMISHLSSAGPCPDERLQRRRAATVDSRVKLSRQSDSEANGSSRPAFGGPSGLPKKATGGGRLHRKGVKTSQHCRRASLQPMPSCLVDAQNVPSNCAGPSHAGARDNLPVSTRASIHLVPAVKGFFRSIALGGFAANQTMGSSRCSAGGGTASAAILQDILRLLTLWFDHGHRPDVHAALQEGLGLGVRLEERKCSRTDRLYGGSINVATWLQVIPQLIARVHYGPVVSSKGGGGNVSSSESSRTTPLRDSGIASGNDVRFVNLASDATYRVQSLLHTLLSRVGDAHPQALIYPLTVASTSTNKPRRRAALSLLDAMRVNSATLVEQALLVSRELIRVAIIWHEMWHGALEEASRQWFGDKDAPAMTETLEPLHQMMEDGPETLHEVGFHHAFGRDLQEAHGFLRKYRRNGKEQELAQAWEIYYHVFRKINKHLPSLTTLELQYVSPALLKARNLELAVPGTYLTLHSHVIPGPSHSSDDSASGLKRFLQRGDVQSSRHYELQLNEGVGSSIVGAVVMISSIAPTLNVITSKQRPRKVMVRGSDGKLYQFLLKGHEDLRQDERVMQLFGLVNALLDNDADTSKRDLSIQRYEVIPLSHDVGLVGWVPSCDTLHQLIREYRDARKVLLNIEHRLMLQMAPEYDRLTLMQKVEVFQSALENTTGQDLYKILWLKSPNSEVWLDRRTNYTRSLAVMSMVGYVLGLGDRHPSNLMLDRYSGKIVHIDFGDCFEVAMHRDKYPEQIPFRLTRMLVNAMEVSGIEGNFRPTCEAVMRVLRDNRDSVMAMLEAFVHDPLINWRLLATAKPADKQDTRPHPTHTDDGVNKAVDDRIQRMREATVGAMPTGVPATSTDSKDVVANSMLPSDHHISEANYQDPLRTSDTGAPCDSRSSQQHRDMRDNFSVELTKSTSSEIAAGIRELAAASLPIGSLVLGTSVQNRSGRERELKRNLAASVKARNNVVNVEGMPDTLGGVSAPSLDGACRELPVRDICGDDEVGTFSGNVPAEELNSRAVAVIERVHAKLTGHDFSKSGSPSQRLDVQTQVQLLIEQAMAHENLCRCYIGWCPFW